VESNISATGFTAHQTSNQIDAAAPCIQYSHGRLIGLCGLYLGIWEWGTHEVMRNYLIHFAFFHRDLHFTDWVQAYNHRKNEQWRAPEKLKLWR